MRICDIELYGGLGYIRILPKSLGWVYSQFSRYVRAYPLISPTLTKGLEAHRFHISSPPLLCKAATRFPSGLPPCAAPSPGPLLPAAVLLVDGEGVQATWQERPALCGDHVQGSEGCVFVQA